MMYITTNFIIAIIKTYMSCFSTALDALASAPGFLNEGQFWHSAGEGQFFQDYLMFLVNDIFLSEKYML